MNAIGRQTSAIQHIPLCGTKAPTQLVTSEDTPSLLVPLMATMGIEGYRSILQFCSGFTLLRLPILYLCCSQMLRIHPWLPSALRCLFPPPRESSCFLSMVFFSLCSMATHGPGPETSLLPPNHRHVQRASAWTLPAALPTALHILSIVLTSRTF